MTSGIGLCTFCGIIHCLCEAIELLDDGLVDVCANLGWLFGADILVSGFK